MLADLDVMRHDGMRIKEPMFVFDIGCSKVIGAVCRLQRTIFPGVVLLIPIGKQDNGVVKKQ